jgi:DNA-binding transcriptional LysR family regulator
LSSIVQFLPEDIAAFQRLFPHVDIDLEEQTSSDVMRSIQEHAADIGICNSIAGTEQFEQLPYRTDHLMLMVPHNHALSNATTVGLADIVNENFVGLGDDSALTQLLAQEAIHLGATLKIKIRVSSLDALCRMVHVGLGIAVVPQQIGEMYTSTLDVRLVAIRDPWAVRQLIVIYRYREQLTATATSLLNFLVNR